MADLSNKYDPDAALPSDREPFPAGQYNVEVTESDIVPTKAGTGELFKYTTKVLDGEHEGRLIWGQMNLTNNNPQAQEIGQGEFKALRVVTDVLSPVDTQDLHFKAFKAAVIIEPAKGEYKAKNAINWRATVKLNEGGDVPATKQPAAANDNKQAAGTVAANDNKAPAPAAKRPWKAKAA